MPTKGNLRTQRLPKYQTSQTELKVPVAVASVSMDPDKSTGQQVSKSQLFLFLRVHIFEKPDENS